MKNRILIIAVLIPLFCIPSLGQEEQTSPLSFWGFFQPMFDTDSKSFSIDTARFFVEGGFDRFYYTVGFEKESGIRLLRADISYKFSDYLQVTFGQYGNAFKFYSKSPEDKYTVNYPIPIVPENQLFDIGVTVHGATPRIEYRFSVFNGPGANEKDDNTDKDIVAFLRAYPWKWLNLGGSWEGGWQGKGSERYYRSGQWLQAEAEFSKFRFRYTWIRRNDLDRGGWFALGFWRFNSKDDLLFQYTWEKENRELTLGSINNIGKHIRILPNIVLQKKPGEKYSLALYVMVQAKFQLNLKGRSLL